MIGTSIAYRLAARGADVIVIERRAVACAASGKSGGFLAMDWCDGTPLMHIARRSFALHAELADECNGEWGYRRLTTYGGDLGGSSHLHSRRAGPGWLSPNISIHGQLGSMGTTAQVQPAAFTAGMMHAAQARGAELRLGTRHGAVATRRRRGGRRSRRRSARGRCGRDRDGALVSARGAMALPSACVRTEGAQPCLRNRNAIPSEALFLEYTDAAGSILSPEIFPRADGTTYVCAISSDAPLPSRSWSGRA